MSNGQVYILSNMTLIIILYIGKTLNNQILATFLRIAFIKLPYLVVGLLLIYFNFSYKCKIFFMIKF